MQESLKQLIQSFVSIILPWLIAAQMSQDALLLLRFIIKC